MANNKLHILRTKSDFSQLRASGKLIKAKRWFFLSYLPNDLPHNRFGWTVSAKVGPAVIRNKLKRWCRQYFRENQSINQKKMDVNVVFRPSDKDFLKASSTPSLSAHWMAPGKPSRIMCKKSLNLFDPNLTFGVRGNVREALKMIFKKTALFLILFYQRAFSLIFGGACRFHPSCSHYALEAYSIHNPYRATLLVAARLLKCRPGGPYGIDLVPAAGQSSSSTLSLTLNRNSRPRCIQQNNLSSQSGVRHG